MRRRDVSLAVLIAWHMAVGAALADEPWVITDDQVVAEAVEVGHVIIVEGGSLTVAGVPEPGFAVSGNLWAIADAEVVFEDSAIKFMSAYHGQYALVGIDEARIEVIGCDYRVPSGVQHGLVTAGSANLVVEDTDFDPVQLVASETSTVTAARLNGNFEVIVQDGARMQLADIPREAGAGDLWVWVEFPSGSVAEYRPPLPGFTQAWTFPPADATGIVQTVAMDRCEVLLWPMLVRERSDLTLRDIEDANWVVVGLHMPYSATIEGLENNQYIEDRTLDIEDRTLRLVDSTVDTWNLYPEEHATIRVRDSVLGEILSFHDSRVVVESSTIDGTGGFFGSRDRSRITVYDSSFTCTVEAAELGTWSVNDAEVDHMLRFVLVDRLGRVLTAHHWVLGNGSRTRHVRHGIRLP